MLISGIYLAMSPWVVGFSKLQSITASNLISGISASILSMGLIFTHNRSLGLLMSLQFLGAWIVASPWVAAGNVDTPTIVNSNLTAGILTFLCSILVTRRSLRQILFMRLEAEAQRNRPEIY
ncbi:SPW repeat protein [Streptomyces sp. NBC_00124]|uniref:SPW repeat protein n=1 Tax=Streptomyces sp. NBC_00124 TaxID=2975662 RepID=UPI00338E2783